MRSSLEPCPVFIAGEWNRPSGLNESPVFNPSRGEVIAEVPICGAEVANAAAENGKIVTASERYFAIVMRQEKQERFVLTPARTEINLISPTA